MFYNLILDFCVITRTRFSLRDKRLFEITEVEITRVDCTVKNFISAVSKLRDFMKMTCWCIFILALMEYSGFKSKDNLCKDFFLNFLVNHTLRHL